MRKSGPQGRRDPVDYQYLCTRTLIAEQRLSSVSLKATTLDMATVDRGGMHDL